ncbi:MAG: hypothetical protein B1H08_02595 [Candidatus Omnitrophica bacterium 4484_171]|nr:MAG: hypothetical protein B1H08_02595 [Candidatus Omnitrophica bacterium 4484_171]
MHQSQLLYPCLRQGFGRQGRNHLLTCARKDIRIPLSSGDVIIASSAIICTGFARKCYILVICCKISIQAAGLRIYKL